MTPLAYRIMKDISGGAARSDDALCELLAPFREEFHCFEVTAVAPLSPPLKQQKGPALPPSHPRPVLPAGRPRDAGGPPRQETPPGPPRACRTPAGAGL